MVNKEETLSSAGVSKILVALTQISIKLDKQNEGLYQIRKNVVQGGNHTDSACLGQRKVQSYHGIDAGFQRSTSYQEHDYNQRQRIQYYESIKKCRAQEHQGPFIASQEAIAKTTMIKERTRFRLAEQRRIEEEKAKEVQ
ncbi:OLC1v1030500C1 [Oldenlandia corymbosa var. corymbosa]|uniref:OLC1v1030500C1 n=1 Tax=Oldenlandia corymbosa var. corymbosa TaxID=529605 RepID=A0AAV1CHT1_OLDCO|nr:OLC1v1030500C1 [Oldenlandia corymbosa var. corymbosa]